MPGHNLVMRVGELVDYSNTCALGAGTEHREWMREWMDRTMGFAAWVEDLRIEVVDDRELEELVTWSSDRARYVTRAEYSARAESGQLRERWAPDLLRVTRRYRVLQGPRGECPLPDQLPPRLA